MSMAHADSISGNDFGKHPLDLHRVISRHKEFDDELKAFGAIVIDSSGPINQTVDAILSSINDN